MKNTETKIYLMGLFFLILDQLSKYLIKFNLKGQLVIIKDFLSFQYLENEGAAFGLFNGERTFLLMITAAMLVVVSKLIRDEKNFNVLSFWSYALLIGGITGNFLDRILNSYVIDFISFELFAKRMPVFNLADSFIVIAVVLIVIETGFDLYGNYNKRRQG